MQTSNFFIGRALLSVVLAGLFAGAARAATYNWSIAFDFGNEGFDHETFSKPYQDLTISVTDNMDSDPTFHFPQASTDTGLQRLKFAGSVTSNSAVVPAFMRITKTNGSAFTASGTLTVHYQTYNAAPFPDDGEPEPPPQYQTSTVVIRGYSGVTLTGTKSQSITGVGSFTVDFSALTGFSGITTLEFDNGKQTVAIGPLTLADPASAPTVTTPTSASVTATTAVLGGNVTGDGGASVTERGVVYAVTATNPNPQINGTGVTKVTASGTTGVFTANVTGLVAGTGYSYAAYATNGVGTSYSSTGTFTAALPTIASATYNAATGVLAATGANITNGGTITVGKLTLTGEGGATRVLTTGNVTASSTTGFSVTLNAADKAAANQILNKNLTVSTGGTTYNLAADDDWDASVTTGNTADATIPVTVSAVAAPAITSATYDVGTGVLAVTGTGFLKLTGAANDIDVSRLSLTGDSSAYTLTTNSVEITDGTAFSVTLNTTDRAALIPRLNQDGTASIGSVTYNLAAAEDWAAGADAAVVVADLTGNGITVSNADATAPAPPSPPDLAPGSDSGTSSTDNITNVTTPTFTGTAEADSTVTLYDTDGTTVLGTATATGGNWSIASSALSAGTHTLTAKATDATGNISPASTGLSVTIDTTAPATTIATYAFSADTGISGTDFITKTAAQTISGLVSANLVAGEIVQVSLDNGSTWSTATTSVGATTWSLAGQTLTASNTLQVRVTDAAGNSGVTVSEAYIFDTTAPATTIATIAFSADTGASGTDFITNTAAQTISGTLSANRLAGEFVEVSLDNGATWLIATSLVGGNAWSIDETLAASNTLSVRVSDAAGNNGTAAGQAYVLDITAPTVTAGNISISGASGTGGVFKSGDTVTATWNNTAGGDNNTDTIASVTADFTQFGGGAAVAATNSSGTWTATYAIAAGSIDAANRNVSVTATDNAGNATTTAGTTNATIDNILPAAPSAPDLDAASDTGSSSTDNLTRDTTPTFTGTAPAGTTVTLLEGATVLGTATATDGNWSITSSVLAAGPHTVKAVAADEATNVSADSGTLVVTIDTSAPALQSIARQNPTTVNTAAGIATWRATFDSAVTGVDVADFAFTVLQGAPAGTIASVTPVSTSVYDVAVNAIAGQGAVRLDLKATGAGIADIAGNALADGGFTTGEFYLVGITSVFDTLNLPFAANVTATLAGPNKPAQRFTTDAVAPLTLSSVTAALGAISGSPAPVVTINADDAGAPGAVIATLANPASLTANSLNVWTGSTLLDPDTVYWLVFGQTDGGASYEVEASIATTGGTGTWLTDTHPAADSDYLFRFGTNSASAQTGALKMALGATSTPTITSTLAANGTYGTAFDYTITATNLPASYAATGLPGGLSVNAATGAITGSPAQAGAFNVMLTATNPSGTGAPATLVVTIGQAALTATASSLSRAFGAANPTLTVSYSGLVNGDTAGSLTTQPVASTAATSGSPVGDYAIVLTGGSSPNYTITLVDGMLTIGRAAQTITLAGPGDLIIGASTPLAATANSGLPVTLSVISGPATLAGNTLTTNGIGLVVVRATQAGNVSYNAASIDRTFNVIVGPANITTPAQVPAPPAGGAAQLVVVNGNPNVDYQWQRNGGNLPNATGPSLAITDAQPPVAGLYTYTATVPGGGAGGTSEPVIVGISTSEKVIGTGEEIGANIVHPNGNTYDQVLLEGNGATVTANPGQTTRVSFIDMQDDIVQVELSGAGSLSLTMDNASAPAPAAVYSQTGVNYVKGHAGIVITGADGTTNVTVFSVGRITAINQALFRDEVTYDGTADIAFIAIQSANGKFGGIRTGNVSYFATQGFTGVYAPGVELTGPMNVGNVSAFDSATPVLIVGSVGAARITGGDLFQPNGQPVKVSGIARLQFVTGTTSHGGMLPAQANRSVLVENGVDVTAQIVVNP